MTWTPTEVTLPVEGWIQSFNAYDDGLVVHLTNTSQDETLQGAYVLRKTDGGAWEDISPLPRRRSGNVYPTHAGAVRADGTICAAIQDLDLDGNPFVISCLPAGTTTWEQVGEPFREDDLFFIDELALGFTPEGELRLAIATRDALALRAFRDGAWQRLLDTSALAPGTDAGPADGGVADGGEVLDAGAAGDGLLADFVLEDGFFEDLALRFEGGSLRVAFTALRGRVIDGNDVTYDRAVFGTCRYGVGTPCEIAELMEVPQREQFPGTLADVYLSAHGAPWAAVDTANAELQTMVFELDANTGGPAAVLSEGDFDLAATPDGTLFVGHAADDASSAVVGPWSPAAGFLVEVTTQFAFDRFFSTSRGEVFYKGISDIFELVPAAP